MFWINILLWAVVVISMSISSRKPSFSYGYQSTSFDDYMDADNYEYALYFLMNSISMERYGIDDMLHRFKNDCSTSVHLSDRIFGRLAYRIALFSKNHKGWHNSLFNVSVCLGYCCYDTVKTLFTVCCFITVLWHAHYSHLLDYMDSSDKLFYYAIPLSIFGLVALIASVYWECRKHGDFSREKSEIIQRRDYLIDKLVVEPEIVISRMPSGIGQQFQGEWGLYSCSMLSASLVNISMIYPETREYNLERIDSLIKIVNTPCLRKYDTVRWNEDAISSLSSNKSHVSYISHLAWMIGGYKSVGGGNQYDELYDNLCEAMNRRILQSPSFNLETYPGEPIYIPDMLVAIVALNQYSKLNGGKYSSTVQEWVNRARNEWCDDKTGLLSSYLDLNGNKISYAPIKGSYSSLNCSYLTLVDETFAKEQYSLLKKYFWKKGLLSGMKEYYDSTPFFAFDIDAGPIIFGLSPSGTAFSVGATTYFEDSEVRKEILRTAEKAGHTISRNNKKHYALANLALVGEAIMLAMRTNVNTNK